MNATSSTRAYRTFSTGSRRIPSLDSETVRPIPSGSPKLRTSYAGRPAPPARSRPFAARCGALWLSWR
jgi:hypothetical protein